MLSRPYNKVGKMTLFRMCTLVLVWILHWYHKMRDKGWRPADALQTLELTLLSVQPAVVLNNAAQVLEAGDHFNGLFSCMGQGGCLRKLDISGFVHRFL